MKSKIIAIQNLRGLSILYVVLFHIGNIFNYHIFSNGSTGYLVFFVISGFTIAYARKKQAGFLEASIFARKRIARIYFPYILPFFTMLFLFLLTGTGGAQARDIVNIIRNLFLVQSPSQSIHPYSWFLVYEIYFYVTYGILVLGFQLNIFAYCALMVTLYVVSLFSIGMTFTQDAILFNSANALFVSGVIIAQFFDKIEIRFKNYLALFTMVLFLVFPFTFKNEFVFLIITVLLFFIYSKSTLSMVWLNKIGDASYSVYLIHAIVLAVLKNIIAARGPVIFLLFFVSCISVGCLYYVYFEQPVVRFAYRILGVQSITLKPTLLKGTE